MALNGSAISPALDPELQKSKVKVRKGLAIKINQHTKPLVSLI